MSSDTTTYAESVSSCCPTAGDALPRLPVRRRLDLLCGAGLDEDNDDDGDFFYSAAEAMERSYHEAKSRASQGPAAPPPPASPERQCICGRGPCDVVWKERDGRCGWAYACPAPPKCGYFAWCEESTLNQNSQPAFRSHPEPSNPCAFNTPSNHRVGATAPINVNLQGAGTTAPVNVSPQGAGTTTPVYVSPHGARSNGDRPICKCAAGTCKKLTIKGVDYYVCPIAKGQGACPYRVPINATVELQQTGNNNPRENKHLEYSPVKKEAKGHNLVKVGGNYENGQVNLDQPEDDEWPFDIVGGDIVHLTPAHLTSFAVAARESPRIPHKPISMVELETPTKSPMPPANTTSPVTPRLNCCFRCGEEGHWSKNCPHSPCYSCGKVGHWSRDCPKSSPRSNICFHCGEVGHWKTYCPVLRDKSWF